MGWCSECDDFLCSDCLKQHKSSKLFKNHSAMTLEDYNELPTIVQTMKYQCEDHDEQQQMYCPPLLHDINYYNHGLLYVMDSHVIK
jgi:hypothetical protein